MTDHSKTPILNHDKARAEVNLMAENWKKLQGAAPELTRDEVIALADYMKALNGGTSFENTAKKIAEAYNGECEQTGGDVWIATVKLANGQCMVFGLDSICVYDSYELFEGGDSPTASFFPNF